MIIAIVAQAWRAVPLLAVLLLAALKTIPGTLYRAAKMDGATTWESFRFITLPAIRPTLIVVGILQVIVGLQVFDLLYTLTNGGPGRSTYVLIYAIYDLAFQNLSFGYGSTVTVVLFGLIVLCSFLLLLFQIRRRRGGDGPGRRRGRAAAAGERGTSLRFDGRSPRRSRRARATRTEEKPRRQLFQLSAARRQCAVRDRRRLCCCSSSSRRSSGSIIASLQTDDALSHMPPHLSLTNVWLDGYTRIIQTPAMAGLAGRQPSDGDPDDDPRDRARGAGRLLAGPVQPARQARDPRRPDLHADGPGHRHGDPGAQDLPDPAASRTRSPRS